MNPKHLKALLHASPFVPFTLVLANGKVHHVTNPDVLNVTLQGQVASEAERSQALTLARSAPGVKRVEDALQVDATLQ